MSSSTFRSVRDLFLLNGKKAIVTGSGGGIGSAVARRARVISMVGSL